MQNVSLRDQYYHENVIAINNAAEARQVEKEFKLAKSHSMHKPNTKIKISTENLTKHFSEKHLDIPNKSYMSYQNNLLLDMSLYKLRDIEYLMIKAMNLGNSKLPIWSAFNSLSTEEMPTTAVSRMPLIFGSPTDWSNLYTTVTIS